MGTSNSRAPVISRRPTPRYHAASATRPKQARRNQYCELTHRLLPPEAWTRLVDDNERHATGASQKKPILGDATEAERRDLPTRCRVCTAGATRAPCLAPLGAALLAIVGIGLLALERWARSFRGRPAAGPALSSCLPRLIGRPVPLLPQERLDVELRHIPIHVRHGGGGSLGRDVRGVPCCAPRRCGRLPCNGACRVRKCPSVRRCPIGASCGRSDDCACPAIVMSLVRNKCCSLSSVC